MQAGEIEKHFALFFFFSFRTLCLRGPAPGADGRDALLLLLPPLLRRQFIQKIAVAAAVLELLLEAPHVALHRRDLARDALDLRDALLKETSRGGQACSTV